MKTPELIVEMVDKWRAGYDVVYAQRRNRDGETWIKRVVSAVGYRIINKIADVNIPPNTGDFRLMSRRVVNSIFCFSNYALTLSSQLGFLIAGLAFVIAFGYAVAKLAGVPFPLGNPTIVILILLMGGIQLISVGILGEYLGRIYEEVKQRPKFIVDRKEGL